MVTICFVEKKTNNNNLHKLTKKIQFVFFDREKTVLKFTNFRYSTNMRL